MRLGKFGIEIALEKTLIVPFSRFRLSQNKRFDFLGFEFRYGISQKGKPQRIRRTSRNKLKASIANFTTGAIRRIAPVVTRRYHN